MARQSQKQERKKKTPITPPILSHPARFPEISPSKEIQKASVIYTGRLFFHSSLNQDSTPVRQPVCSIPFVNDDPLAVAKIIPGPTPLVSVRTPPTLRCNEILEERGLVGEKEYSCKSWFINASKRNPPNFFWLFFGFSFFVVRDVVGRCFRLEPHLLPVILIETRIHHRIPHT